MSQNPLEILSDVATEAHTRIQQDFKKIDPIVGVSQKMRASGIPADVMTIDCLKTGKRIILILQDQQPGVISYQFSFKAKDPDDEFKQIAFSELDADKLLSLIHI